MWYHVVCRVVGDAMSPVASLTDVGFKVMFGRLRVLVCVVFGSRFGQVFVMRLVC